MSRDAIAPVGSKVPRFSVAIFVAWLRLMKTANTVWIKSPRLWGSEFKLISGTGVCRWSVRLQHRACWATGFQTAAETERAEQTKKSPFRAQNFEHWQISADRQNGVAWVSSVDEKGAPLGKQDIYVAETAADASLTRDRGRARCESQ